MGIARIAALVLLATTFAHAELNPLARPARPSLLDLNGRWNGVNLERRSACTSAQNEGSRGTYAQFDIVADAAGNIAITQSGITGLNCTYTARYQAGPPATLQGTLSCNDGKQGAFSSGSVQQHGQSVDIRMALRLSGNETCTVDSLLSMGRLPQ